jgi:chromosome segregation ATPase
VVRTDVHEWLEDHNAFKAEVRAQLRAIRQQLTRIEEGNKRMSEAQDAINAAVQEDQTLLTDLQAQSAKITDAVSQFQAAITALETANPSVDTSALVAANQSLADAATAHDAAVQALADAAAAAGPPAPTP